MQKQNFVRLKLVSISIAFYFGMSIASAQKKYDPGANDTEIRIGQTLPYSGPVSMLGNVGKVSAAYLEMVNAQGGVNG